MTSPTPPPSTPSTTASSTPWRASSPRSLSTWTPPESTSWASSPGRDSLIRLVGAILAEQHDEWTEGRRYLGLDILARSRIAPAPASTRTEVDSAGDLQALSA
jgi:hypothetical protein